MNPLEGIGLLYHEKEFESRYNFLGTCFAFRHPTYLLTASHCIGKLSANDCFVLFLRFSKTIAKLIFGGKALSIQKHPNADIALLRMQEEDMNGVQPFWDCVGNYALGEDFTTYGFPEDISFPKISSASQPTPRLFRGYFQRFFDHHSHLGYRYIAGELNIPCPAGLSGSPLFRLGAPSMLTGMVTENIESTKILDSVEEIQEDGEKYKHIYQKIITYGICLMLHDVRDWLDKNIPKRQHKAIQ